MKTLKTKDPGKVLALVSELLSLVFNEKDANAGVIASYELRIRPVWGLHFGEGYQNVQKRLR